MSEMIPNNPLLMDTSSWNWVQFALSLPVVFYAAWMFLYVPISPLLLELKYVYLIGIGSGLLSIQPVWLIFPRILSKRIQN
jgi:Cu2+-exporting ATPase